MCSIATLTTRVGPLHIYSESALMAVLTSISLDIELKGNYTRCNHEVHYAHGNHDFDNVKGKTQNNEDSDGGAKERMGTHSSTLEGFDISEWANYAKKKARIASSTSREIGRLKTLLKAALVPSNVMKSETLRPHQLKLIVADAMKSQFADPFDISVLDPWASASLPALASIASLCSDIDPWTHWRPCGTSPPVADMVLGSDVVELNASPMKDDGDADFDQLHRAFTRLQHLQETMATKEDLTATLSNAVAKVSDEKPAVNVGGVNHEDSTSAAGIVSLPRIATPVQVLWVEPLNDDSDFDHEVGLEKEFTKDQQDQLAVILSRMTRIEDTVALNELRKNTEGSKSVGR